jgi:AraC-like DNA-binding protein
MQLASEALTTTGASIAEIAQRLGYGSEAALSRAFKRIVGVPPAHWRQGRRQTEGAAATAVRPRPIEIVR